MVVRTSKTYSRSSFQVYNTGLSITVIIPSARSWNLIDLIPGNLHPLTGMASFPQPLACTNLLSMSYEFGFFRFHI